MGCHFFLQGIFPTQGSNPCLLHWQTDSLPLSQQGSPSIHLIPSNPCFSFRHPNSLICLLYYMFSDIFLLQYYFGQCDISVLVLHWRLCCDYLVVYLHAIFELSELGPCWFIFIPTELPWTHYIICTQWLLTCACVLSRVQLFGTQWTVTTGSSVHGILQAKILEWFAISSSRGSPWPWIEPVSLMSPALAGRFLPLDHLGTPWPELI